MPFLVCMWVAMVLPVRAELLCDGKTIPSGTVCCEGGTYCPANHMCIREGGQMRCLPYSSPRACKGGKYCGPGYVCAPEGGCLSVTSTRYCGGRQFCKPGFVCLNDKSCLSITSERYCGDGKYCNLGSRCIGNGKCESVTATGPSTNPPTGSPTGKGKIPDSCLSIGESKRVSGTIGECTKKDGSTGHYYFTMVKSTGARGCPKEIDFDYLDKDDDKIYQFSTPFNVQTCDAPPITIEVVNK